MQIEKALIDDRLAVSKVLKVLHSSYLKFCSNLPVKFAIFVKSSLLFNSFYCPFFLQTHLYGSVT